MENEYILTHEFNCPIDDSKELGDEVVRIRWSKDNSMYTRNSFVTITIVGGSKKIYRILKGVSSEKLSANQLLVSYSTYKCLGAIDNSKVSLTPSTFLERNLFFYLSNPDPRKQHAVIRDFVIIGVSLTVSILEIIRFMIGGC
jgi:hypothetical protein